MQYESRDQKWRSGLEAPASHNHLPRHTRAIISVLPAYRFANTYLSYSFIATGNAGTFRRPGRICGPTPGLRETEQLGKPKVAFSSLSRHDEGNGF